METNDKTKLNLEIWEKRFSNLKSIFFIISNIIIIILVLSHWSQIMTWEAKKMNIAGFELGPKEKIETIEKAMAASDSLSLGKTAIIDADNAISISDQKMAQAIEDGLSVGSPRDTTSLLFWIYLGGYDYNKKRWTSQSFDFKETPKAGDIVKAITATYKRDDFLQQSGVGEKRVWKKAKIIGVVHEKEEIKVVQVRTIEGKDNPMYPTKTLYWAQAQMIK